MARLRLFQAETYGFNEDRTDTKVTDSNDVETDETNDGATDGYDDREWIQWPIDSDDSTGSGDGFRLRQDFHFKTKRVFLVENERLKFIICF